ncbi:hypothetical protein DFR50_105207 [Roseiarcus fermentans]|uniref:Homogentisate 1,2-dioxygenase n=1 Tax=Roseiarcus fermentans TaxID=1473586 RepID=A0A366FPE1_9HYPH|nr:hypothetical protein [Roseiarcus fermentans]RBP16563.1 hypothetical protein DFR50_105207 [Roseiarcus fermentans]
MKLGRLVLAAALALAAPGVAGADEPHGCAAFRWPLDRERAALGAAEKPVVANGGALRYEAASTLKLAPFADAALPHPPERAPKAPGSYAGHFTLAAPAKPGLYKVTIAANGWIDVVDNGAFLHPKAFSGVLDCEGARKSVKFDLPGRALDLQLSGVTAPDIAVIVTAAE